ncbi:hypothetical protein ACQ4PT_050182 [Festuca glaucescens]
MEVMALVSGGKDSCFSMMRCLDYGHKVVALANLIPLDDAVDELDSYMDHALKYSVTPGDEVEDMFALLSEVKRRIPSIGAVSSGAIASDYQRLRVESVCSRLGLVSLAYMWKQDQTQLLEEMNARIVLDDFEVILQSADSIASVGILHPLAFHVEAKPGSSGSIEDGTIAQESSSCLYEVNGGIVQTDVEDKQTRNPTPTSDAYPSMDVCISKTGKTLFSIGCWTGKSSSASKGIFYVHFVFLSPMSTYNFITSIGLKADLAAVLSRIQNKLMEDGLTWANVLYVHLYISSMKEFALANEVYVSFITEKKCHLGVPSRSTIELPLVQAGLGNAYVEVLVSNDLVKKVLHVQSISCWAPSCIGPYSQATLYGEILYMAGQLGLDPPTMKLCPGGATAQLELALRNSEAVANAFKSSIFSSAIHFLVYCSAHLTSSEKEEVEHELQNSYIAHLDSSRTGSACVEIKPTLYVPADNGYSDDDDDVDITSDPETGGSKPASSKVLSEWSARYSDLHDSCCLVHTVTGKICSAVVSITNGIASKIYSSTEQLQQSEEHLKAIARFCVFQIAKILIDNGFTWDSVTMLRFYYSVEHSLAADVLSRMFSEAFAELGKATGGSLRTDGVPVFNVLPVSGSGRSASMLDILTCELLASKA